MIEEEKIEQYCKEQGYPAGACNSQLVFQHNIIYAAIKWADKHPHYQYYTMGNCPNCKFVLFYNPCHNNYFVGKLDKNDNLVIDNEIQGKSEFFNHLYWTNLPEFDKNNVINYNK